MNLLEQLRLLRQQVRRLLWRTGLGWTVGCVVTCLLVLGLLDWTWRWEVRSPRVLGWLGGLSLVAWVFWNRLAVPLRWPLANVELAAQLERYFPKLHGRLTASVEFLEQGVPSRAGSPELQRRLIEQTTATVQALHLGEVLDRRSAVRATWFAVAACSGLLLSLIADPMSARVAIQRSVWPFGAQRWPQRVELQLVRGNMEPVSSEANLRRIAKGRDLDLFVINRLGPLPQPVLVEYRRSGESRIQIESLRVASLRDAEQHPRDAAAVRLPEHDGLVEFRAVGGDDRSMAWQRLEFVAPPTIARKEIVVVSPRYTGDSESVLPDDTTRVRVLQGSRLRVTIVPSRLVASVEWRDPLRDEPIMAKPIASSVSDNATAFQLDVEATAVGTTTHSVILTDADGIENPEAGRLEIQVHADPPPLVTLVEPESDQTVTPDATIRLLATAKDDRRVKELFIELRHERLDGILVPQPTGGEVAEHWQRAVLPDGSFRTIKSTELTGYSDSFSAELPFQSLVSLFGEPVVGDVVWVRGVASDECDVAEPRWGTSSPRRMTVVSRESKSAEIASRLDLLLHDLESLASRESQAKDQTVALKIQAETGRSWRPEDHDALKRVESDQRQIAARLVGLGDSVLSRARRLLREIERNRLPDAATKTRTGDIELTLGRLSEEPLPKLEAQLSLLLKRQRLGSEAVRPEIVSELVHIADAQGFVQSTLEKLVRDLSQWRGRRELAREIAELTDSQKRLHHEVVELTSQTLGKTVSQLSSQQQADVAKLADQQSRHAERIEQLQQRLRDDATRSPEIADDDHDVVTRELDRRALTSKSRAAAKEIADNNLGQAARTQQQVASELNELAEQLAQSSSTSQSSSTAGLREFETELQSVLERQQKLLKDTANLSVDDRSVSAEQRSQQSQKLSEHQAELRKQTNELSQRLQKSSAADSSAALRRATRHMQQSERELVNQQLDSSRNEQQEAIDDLQQARQEVAQSRRQSDRDQLHEQARQLAEQLKTWITQQQTVIKETERLKSERDRSGSWTRPLSKAALNLGEAEQALSDGVREQSRAWADSETMRLLLEQTSDTLESAAKRLRGKQVDELTRQHEAIALKSLEMLANVLVAPTSPAEPNAEADSESQTTQAGDQEDDILSPIAQLKLLQNLQDGVSQLTKGVHNHRETPQPADSRDAMLAELGQAQGAIQDRTNRLLERVPLPKLDQVAPEAREHEAATRDQLQLAMRRATESLTARKTDETTQLAQQESVKEMNGLQKLWEQRAKSQPALARSGKPASKPGDEIPKHSPESSTSEGVGGKPTGRENAQARQSSQRDDTGANREAQLRAAQRLREAVWGHLPPALREKMLNLPHDQVLPKYSEHIRRYYEALAEQ